MARLQEKLSARLAAEDNVELYVTIPARMAIVPECLDVSPRPAVRTLLYQVSDVGVDRVARFFQIHFFGLGIAMVLVRSNVLGEGRGAGLPAERPSGEAASRPEC